MSPIGNQCNWQQLARLAWFCFTIMVIYSCQTNSIDDLQSKGALFKLLHADETGLHSSNDLLMTEEFNVFDYMNFFNGGGVALADFNNDGLIDIFLTRNQSSNRLYLNTGELEFEDVTVRARLKGPEGFSTGTSPIDINQDGMMDIYVAQLSGIGELDGQTQLYLCDSIVDGIPYYTDKASELGIVFKGLNQQASFFDFDKDGDLDMFQLNQSVHQSGISRGRRNVPHKDRRSGDRLLRNDSDEDSIKFTDVTSQAGIESTALGFGLGIATSDLNNDGWVDIYVTNDFHENDYLYINQKDGTFKESIASMMRHTSRFSMGVDIADINNDGWQDVFTLDMLPEDPFIMKTSLGEDGYNVYQLKLDHGYHYQYSRNCLQLNLGNNNFSDIGILSGVEATDWSWSALFADFNYDGYQDLFISNGIPRRMNNIDYVNFKLYDQKFQGTELSQNERSDLTIIDQMPQMKLFNKFFTGTHNSRFNDVSGEVQQNKSSYSNGAAIADLDNDGDLDIVTNNIENYPFIYQNLLFENGKDSVQFLKFKFEGYHGNKNGIGSKVIIHSLYNDQNYEYYPVRGYMSGSASAFHIGLADDLKISSIDVLWANGHLQTDVSYDINELSIIHYDPNDKSGHIDIPVASIATIDISSNTNLAFTHVENTFNEFTQEALITEMMSTEGPALAIGDINGDGLSDIYLGGALRQEGKLLLQTNQQSFKEHKSPVLQDDLLFEDIDALFLDLENDGDQDLVIASGGNQLAGNLQVPKHRAYINDGSGGLTRAYLFPEAEGTVSSITSSDFDNDGDLDIFFASRVVQNAFGLLPDSYLYKNRGDGSFDLVEDPVFMELGMITDAVFTDIDQDDDEDLVLALDWGPITILENNDGHFEKKQLNKLQGLWRFVLPFDLDQDGDIDILAGNHGLNSRLKASTQEPLRYYIEDFDYNGTLEQILTYHVKGQETLFHTHQELVSQLPILKKKYLYASDLAEASISEIFGAERLKDVKTLSVNSLASAWFEQTSSGSFIRHQLPDKLQWSTLRAGQVIETGNSETVKIMIGGNMHATNVELGRYDADYGNILSINTSGIMSVSALTRLGIKGQIRQIKSIELANQQAYIIARNNDSALALTINED